MKVEVLFEGNSLDTETYGGQYVTWAFVNGNLNVLEGKDENDTLFMVATYPERRVVRVRHLYYRVEP